MNHFLITRFNVKFSNWEYSKDGSKTRSNKWLEERIKLFSKYCLPSVVNQTNQNFKWLIYLDTGTSEEYIQEILSLLKPYLNFHPIFIDKLGELLPATRSFIKQHASSEYIITTRLDNDDIIHKEFIKTIQQLATNKEQVIDLRKGYQLDITKSFSEFRDYTHAFNPFVSLVEPIHQFKTIFSKRHHDWKDSEVIRIYTKKRLWVEVVHQKNLINYTKPLPLTKRLNIKKFGLKGVPKQRSMFYLLNRNFFRKIKPNTIKLKKRILG